MWWGTVSLPARPGPLRLLVQRRPGMMRTGAMGYAAALQSRHSDSGGLQHIPAPTMPSGHLQEAALIFSFGQVEQRNLFPEPVPASIAF